MYLKRKIDDVLNNWHLQEDRLPLVIKGCRQVGKTESIRHFAASHYESFIEINFSEDPKYKSIIEDGYSARDIIKNISLLNPSFKFIEGKTLIFFDELQVFPEIATSLKFFKQDGRFDVICSGSLLGINYQRIESNSVGYKQDIIMRPLDFEEFLWAKGYDDEVVEDLYSHMIEGKALSKVFNDTFYSLFMDFTILGGMPAVVRQYIEKDTFENSLALQHALINDFKEDIQKYVQGMDKTRILNIFKHIPVQLSKEQKKFQISKVENGARYRDYRGGIEWLENAGIVNICYCLNSLELPLNGNYDENALKLYLADTGLLVSLLDEEAQDDLRANRNLNVYKGALYENVVADALVKSGYNLFYYKRQNPSIEEDFFLRTANELVPLEVKASDDKARSLSKLIQSDNYPEIKFGIKLVKGNIGVDSNILTFPHFCAFLLKRLLKDKRLYNLIKI
ncbi:MAG: ATP-binding protein [Succinatimonas sp.]|nr:ATP-binding protein [Succinatimonas sp.]